MAKNKPQPKPSSPSKDSRVEAIQRALGLYYKGKLDGLMGDLTRDAVVAAMRDFETTKAQLLAATAELDKTKAALTAANTEAAKRGEALIKQAEELNVYKALLDPLRSLPDAVAALSVKVDDLKTTTIRLGELDMSKTDELLAEVQEQNTVVASVGVLVEKLLQGQKDLRDQLAAQGVDTTKIDEAIAQLDANTSALQAAVLKGTPQEDDAETHGLTT